MATPSGSAPTSPRADPPTITVEEHVDAPATPVDTLPVAVDTETKAEAANEEQVDVEEQKEGEKDVGNQEAAVEAEVAEKPTDEITLPASPSPDAAPEPELVVASPGELNESNEPLNQEHLDTSNASNKDLPLPPTDESASVENTATNERTEEVAEALPPPQENGHTHSELSTSPEVIVRAPSTDLPPTPSAIDSAPALVQEVDLHSVPPPIPEKIKSPVDRSSAASGYSQRNASVSSVRTSTPGPGGRPSISSATSHASHRTNGSRSFVSPVVITSALDSIASSREAKRSAPFRDSITHALELVKSGKASERPREIFEPLRMAVETHSEKLMVTGLDCIAKLVSYGFFAEDVLPEQAYNSPPPSPAPGAKAGSSEQSSAQMPLADLVTNTVTAAYTDSTPDPVSLQIVKALLSLVLSPTILVHHSSLLKAVRTVYNVFLLSNDAVNQMVAQGGLTQMVNHVFARCKVGEDTGAAAGSMDSRPASRGPLSGRAFSRSASATASVTSLAVANGAGMDPDAEVPTAVVNGAADSNADLEIAEPSTAGLETVVSPTEATETPRTLLVPYPSPPS